MKLRHWPSCCMERRGREECVEYSDLDQGDSNHMGGAIERERNVSGRDKGGKGGINRLLGGRMNEWETG